MPPISRLKSALATTVLLAAGFSVHAADSGKMIKDSDDWSLWETKNGSTCYMQSSGEDETFLVLIKAKNNPRSPVEMMVQLTRNSKGYVAGKAATIANTSIAFGDLDGRKQVFQAIPKNLAATIIALRDNKPSKISFVNGKNTTSISARGFKNIIKEMESRCNAGAPLVSADFEASFMNVVSDNVDPAVLTPAKSADIRSVYFAAYPLLLDKRLAEGELNAVLAKFKPSQDELVNNRARATSLQNNELPASRADLAKTQEQQVTSRADIQRLEKEIGPLDAKVKASQKALDEVEDKIAPLRPKVNSLSNSLSTAERINADSTARLAQIEYRIPEIDQLTGQLQGEANYLASNLPAQQREADAAGYRYNEAYSNRASYNPIRRRESLLAYDNEYQRLGRAWTEMVGRRDQAKNELRNISNQRDSIARELRSCQNGSVAPNALRITQVIPGRPGNPLEPRPPGAGGPGPGGGGNRGPGHGGGGHNPNPTEPPSDGGGDGLTPGAPGNGDGGLTPVNPPAAPDCSRLEEALRSADAQKSQKQIEVSGFNSRIGDIEDSRARIALRIDAIVDRELRDLKFAEDQARYASEQATAVVNNNTTRLNRISRNLIPDLSIERASLVNEKPGTLQAIASSKAEMNKLSTELAAYKKANDWDKKEAAVAAKTALLRQDQSNLDVATSSKAVAERSLANAIAREADINSLITRLNSELATLNARSIVLDGIIAQLPGERSPIDARISTMDADLKAKQERILNQLRN